MVLDSSLLNAQYYMMSKVKWSNPGKGVTPSSNGGAHGVMVIIIGNGHSDTTSNPG